MAIEKKSQVPCTLSPKFSFVYSYLSFQKKKLRTETLHTESMHTDLLQNKIGKPVLTGVFQQWGWFCYPVAS